MRRVLLLATLALIGSAAHAQAPRSLPEAPSVVTSAPLFAPAKASADVVLTNLLDTDTLTTFVLKSRLDSGSVTGTNFLLDRAKAAALQLPAGQTTGLVKGVDVLFFYKRPGATTATYKIALYNGTPATGPSGAALFEATYSVAAARAATAGPVRSVQPTMHTFAQPVPVGRTFFVSIEFGGYPRAEAGRLLIASSLERGKRLDTAWEQWADGTWHNISDAWFYTNASPEVGVDGTDLAIFAVLDGATASESDARPDALALSAPQPNPFGAATTLAYTLPESGAARLSVYDALGRRVAVLADGAHAAGPHAARFEAAGLPAGVYVARLEANGGVRTRLVTLAR